MNRTAAEKICATFENVTAQIYASVAEMQRLLPIADFSEYRRTAGKIMGEIFLEILQPIYNAHPELTPKGLQPDLGGT